MTVFVNAGQTDLPFSQAIRCGSWVFVSAQAAVNPETCEIVQGSLHEEMSLSFQNLRARDAAGSSWNEIARVSCPVWRQSDLAEYEQIYYSPTTGPLPPTLLFEVDCMASSPGTREKA